MKHEESKIHTTFRSKEIEEQFENRFSNHRQLTFWLHKKKSNTLKLEKECSEHAVLCFKESTNSRFYVA